MADMIRKLVTCEVKEIADRVLEFVGSTEAQDRDGEVIAASGWGLKNYKKNPVFMWAHRYMDPPIGKAQKVWIENGNLVAFQLPGGQNRIHRDDFYTFAEKHNIPLKSDRAK